MARAGRSGSRASPTFHPIMSWGSASASTSTRRSPRCSGSRTRREGGGPRRSMGPKWASAQATAESASMAPTMATTVFSGP
jgi:hypothetical protein